MEKKTKDLVFSFVLAILGIYVFVEGLFIFKRAASAPYFITDFSISPGFLPTVLGVLLLLCSFILAYGSLKNGEGIKNEFVSSMKEFGSWFKNNIANKDYLFTAGGVVIMGIYTFLLMEFLPFWLASLIFLIALFFYLRAGKWWKVTLVAIAAVALIVIVFQYCFNAALP